MSERPISLGIDLATSNARIVAVDFSEHAAVIAEVAGPLSTPELGEGGRARQLPAYPGVVAELLDRLANQLGSRMRQVGAISVSATSGTVVGVDAAGQTVGHALLYFDSSGSEWTSAINQRDHNGRPTGSLGRMAVLHNELSPARIMTSADTVTAMLTGFTDVPSDTSHTLKAAVNLETGQWPWETLAELGIPDHVVPALVTPGTVLGTLRPEVARRWRMAADVSVVAGMTDGCTSQIATGALSLGDTVGVLGTTLVLKGSSSADIRDSKLGVYSHRSPDGLFLPGGASNVGGASLPETVSVDRLLDLTFTALAEGPSPDVVYPLPRVGERFPFHHPTATPLGMNHLGDRDEGIPAILQGIALVERLGRDVLGRLGVPLRRHVVSGGAALSGPMNRLRATFLGQSVIVPAFVDSAVGAAILAASTLAGSTLSQFSDSHGAVGSVVDPVETPGHAVEDTYQAFLDLLRSARYIEG